MPNKTIKQASDLRGVRIERAITIERAAVNQDQRTVELAFATENPCERWYGFEILDCKPESVRLDRLLSGGPLLLGHDADDQIGVVESVSVGSDAICRATVRFSKASDADEIFVDVLDGIRRNVSVGYLVHEAQLEKEVEGVCYYRVTDWEPYEVSIVPMPADTTCGVGRDLQNEPEKPLVPEHKPLTEEKRAMNKCTHCGAELAEGASCTCSVVRAAEQKRVSDIMTRAGEYAAQGGIEVATTMLKEKGAATVEDFNQRMLDKITASQTPGTPREPEHRSPVITTGLRYDKRSLQPFMRGSNNSSQLAERAAYTSGMWARAVIFGDDSALRWCKDNSIDVRVMTSTSGSGGGFLVPDVLEGAIIDLRAEYGVARRLAEFVPLSSGTVEYPVRKTGTTAYFPGEQTATTESDMAWGQAHLAAKEVSALSRISQSLAEDAIIDLGAKIADEHAYAFAVKEDSCLIDGDGTSTYGGIVGLKSKLETASMAGIYTCASNTDTPAEVIAGELSGLMAKLPSYARKGAAFMTSPEFDELIFGRLMALAGGNTTVTLAGETTAAYLGKARVVCEPCYSDPTADLTGKAIAFYGNFKQGILFGERRGITVQILRERYAEYRHIGVIGTERIDINCHGVGDTGTRGPIVALIGG